MPLHVLMDGRMFLGRFSGVARFVTSLANELARRDDICLTMLCGNEATDRGSLNSRIEIATTGFKKSDRTPIRRSLWEAWRLPRIVREINPDVFHATWNHGAPATSIVPSVLTIHDLIPWYERPNQLSGYFSRIVYRRSMKKSFRRASEIVTVSKYAEFEVRATLGNAKPIRTVYNGAQKEPSDGLNLCDESCTRPFALYVGGHEERKNVAGVFAAMHSYWANFAEPLELWLTGDAQSLSPSAAREYEKTPDPMLVRFLCNPSDESLKQLYASARALLMLSFDEGFGLPAAEAMAQGCPVIAANRASLPEIVGDGGFLVDPDQPTEVASVMHSVIHDQTLRVNTIARGLERAKIFSWKETARTYVEIYERLAAERRANRPNAAQIAVSRAPRRNPHSAS